MASRTARVIGVLALVATATNFSLAKAGEKLTAKAALDKLKTLAGDWKNTSKDEHGGGDHAGGISYRVTGNGSTVMETDFAGQSHEMITMYHLDGDELILTHYCALGNQPRLKLDRAKSTADNLIFSFDGGTN